MPSVVVKGMTCQHCKKSVTDAISNIPGVSWVDVDLASGQVRWDGESSADVTSAVVKAIIDIGFDVEQ